MAKYKGLLNSSFVWIMPILFPVLIVLLGLISICLILAGVLYSWLAVLLFIPAAAWATMTIAGKNTSVLQKKSVGFVDAAAIAFVVVWAVFNAFFTTQHLFIDRDPGFYENTAVWVSQNPDLDFGYQNAFGDEARLDAPGFNERNGEQYVQGAHLLPALLGTIGKFVGVEMMFKMVVLFGAASLLAVYSFARNIVKPKWALIGTMLLSSTLPFFYFSRDSYTEPLSMAAIFAGLTLLLYAQVNRKSGYSLWILSGLMFAAATMTRIDGLMIAACISGAALIGYAHQKPGDKLLAKYSLLIAVVLAGVALLWFDITEFSAVYYDAHDGLMRQLFMLLAAAIVVGISYILIKRNTKLIRNLTKKLSSNYYSWVIVGLVALAGLVMVSRPIWYEHRQGGNNGIVTEIQVREELDVDGTRKYAELTTDWLSVYIGPFAFALAGLGILIVARRFSTGRAPHLLPFVAVFIVVAGIYLWRPSITPDQVWASRRMLPVIIPSLIVFAMIAIDYLYPQFMKKKPQIAHSIAYVVLGLSLAVPTLSLARPYATMAANQHLLEIQEVCVQLAVKDNPAVLYAGLASNFYAHPTRTICETEASNYRLGRNNGLITKQLLGESIQTAIDSGYDPVVGVFGDQRALFEGWEDMVFLPAATVNYQDVEKTLTTKPDKRATAKHFLFFLDIESAELNINGL